VKKDGSRAFVEVNARRLLRNRATTGFQISARDVTEQKRLRSMVLETERLAAICQLGIAVRHEINNPLTTVIGNAELLLDQEEQGDKDMRKRIEVILQNALRIAEIVKRLEGIKKDKVVEYLQGVKMTDLKQG
jgi:two-component system NtrC family sensor kinase